MGERKKGKEPKSSNDFIQAIVGSGMVEKEKQAGSHRTFTLRHESSDGDEVVENVTIICGSSNLKDTNPKVWHTLVKQLKRAGVLALAISSVAAEYLPAGAEGTLFTVPPGSPSVPSGEVRQ